MRTNARNGSVVTRPGLDAAVKEGVRRARADGRGYLSESEGFHILGELGFGVPRFEWAAGPEDVTGDLLAEIPGDHVVVKADVPDLLHKSDEGALAIVNKHPREVCGAMAAMRDRLVGRGLAGFNIFEYVAHPEALERQWFLGCRWTEDFGPVVSLGPGGLHAEFLSKNLIPECATTVCSPEFGDSEILDRALGRLSLLGLATEPFRGRPPIVSGRDVRELLERLFELARRFMPEWIEELEINPLVLSGRGPVALDVLVKVGREVMPPEPDRPLARIKNLLAPQSIAVMGASHRMNAGHIILNNILSAGFDPSRLYVIKPGAETLEGCRCVPTVSSLPEPVDLLVASVAARSIPEVVAEVVTEKQAQSVIAIPGGLGERRGSEGIAVAVHSLLRASRSTEWGGPVINGGNCLGVRSVPGKYDTLFIPRNRLPAPRGASRPLAVVAQSGAFAVTRASKYVNWNPRYMITVGNQTDLTVGDYLTYLKDDPEIDVFACYVEGFKPLDGLRWLKAAAEIVASGRTVVLYRAGRTPAGVSASSSHTAVIAGDYVVTRELAESVGVLVAGSLGEFDDLVRLAFLLGKRSVGPRLGAVSNAGFECVAVADNLGAFTLAEFTAETRRRIHEQMIRSEVDALVEVQNPLDVTPMAGDHTFGEAVRAVLLDPGVDVAVVGCVPLTPALETMPRAGAWAETSVVANLAALQRLTDKAWVAVIDGGRLYDPMAGYLGARDIPVFRDMDRAMRRLNRYCEARRRVE